MQSDTRVEPYKKIKYCKRKVGTQSQCSVNPISKFEQKMTLFSVTKSQLNLYSIYLVSVQPRNYFIALVHNSLFVLRADLVLELLIFHGALQVEGQRLEWIFGCDFVSLSFIFWLELLCFLHHAFNVLLAQPPYLEIKYKTFISLITVLCRTFSHLFLKLRYPS